MTTALSLTNVSFAYRSDWKQKLVNVIRNVTLTVEAGEAFGFLGHNGAGKTTTIKCILGLCSIRSGQIEIFGRSHKDPLSRSVVGYLPEQPYFYENLTVAESLAAYGSLAGVNNQRLKHKIEELLTTLSLHEKRNAKMRALSKGLMQRVGLAQSIIADPKLLILDEPFSGLDPIGRKEFRDIILDLKRKGTTIFMSSHILNDVETICDRASIMVRGEIKEIYDLKALTTQVDRDYEILVNIAHNQIQTFQEIAQSLSCIESKIEGNFGHIIMSGNIPARSALQQLIEKDFSIQSFEPLGSSLEKVFVDLVKGAK